MPLLFIGGPLCGQHTNPNFARVAPTEYLEATWYDHDGSVICDIYQHESIKTIDDFNRAVMQWQLTRE